MIAAALLIATAPTAHAIPQCWDRYSQQNLELCGGNPNAPGSFPGTGPGQPDSGGGLLGLVHRLTGGLL